MNSSIMFICWIDSLDSAADDSEALNKPVESEARVCIKMVPSVLSAKAFSY